MTAIISFALLHNSLITVSYFLWIGLTKAGGNRNNSLIQVWGVAFSITTGWVIATHYRVQVVTFLFYIFLLFLLQHLSRFLLSTWKSTYRRFYASLVITMTFYLLYKLAFFVEVLLPAALLRYTESVDTSMVSVLSTFIGQIFFIFLFLSEVFVLVSSLYAIHDSIFLAATSRQNNSTNKLFTPGYQQSAFPMVSIHVPVRMEPPKMVAETLSALSKINYPNFEVIVVSNNTKDKCLWLPVQESCSKLGFKFLHFESLHGFKAGALNRALQITNANTEFVCVVDSDYLVLPGFLQRTVPLLQNPSIAFLQTSQDYRNRNDSLFLQTVYPVYKLFFDVVLTARDRRNSIMFAGTMGLIRKNILKQLGGWNEQCIAEDADISLRILNLGYQGVYLNETWGHGLLPDDFSACEKQWTRWMMGGIQVVRLNFKTLLDRHSQLTFAQRWDYAIGGIMTFGAFLTINSALCLAGFALVTSIAPESFQSVFADLSTSLLIFSFFITLTAMMVILTFKWNMNYPAGKSIGAFVVVMGLSWARARAVWFALTHRQLFFERTEKFQSTPSIIKTLWNTRYTAGMVIIILMINIVIINNYETPPFGLIIISFWQEVTYIASIGLSLLSLKR